MRKILVVLICLLAVFAVVSCKNDPENTGSTEKKPVKLTEAEHEAVLAGNAFYRLTATMMAKRFTLQYEGGENGINPKEGDILTLKYRSEHPVTHLYLRDDAIKIEFLKKYVILEEGDPYISAPDEDGWITLTFTYPAAPSVGSYDEEDGTVSGFRIELVNYDDKFAVDDYLDIKDLAFNGTKLTIDGPVGEKEASGYQSVVGGVWSAGNGDQTDPTIKVMNIDSEN